MKDDVWLGKRAFKENEMEHELGHEIPRMPFGKYKGFALKDIPVPYLEWARLNFSRVKHGALIKKITTVVQL